MFDNTTLEMTNMLKYVTILWIKCFPIPGQGYKFPKFIGKCFTMMSRISRIWLALPEISHPCGDEEEISRLILFITSQK